MTDTLTANAIATSLSEADFTDKVIDRAQARGWLCYHARPARMKDGRWRTPTQGDPGWPDLALAHPKTHRVLFVELKSEKGRVTEAQRLWLDALGGTVWRPSDWGKITATLDREA